MDAAFAGALALANAALTAALIVALRPLLLRYALARPNPRSLHAVPTPQGGGAAIVIALCATLAMALALRPFAPADARILVHVAGAAFALAIVGAIDDVRPIPSLPRLAVQLVLAWVALAALPDAARIVPVLPPLAERLVLVVALAWFVNLTNFMDGMDGMTVIEMAPLCAALLGMAALGLLPWGAALLLAALLGGLVGFAPFNAPVAKLFLGDVGSLAIGLVVGFCLILLAGNGALAAALLLPLYYIADSGITLAWRLQRGEKVWQAHRSHFYQTAVARGMGVRAVLARVFGLNVALVALAFASLRLGAPGQVACVALGAAAVALVLRGFCQPK